MPLGNLIYGNAQGIYVWWSYHLAGGLQHMITYDMFQSHHLWQQHSLMHLIYINSLNTLQTGTALLYIYTYCQCLGMWCDFRIRWILSVSMVTVRWCKFFSCVVLIGMLVTDYTKFNDPVLNFENSAHEWKKSVHEIVYNWSLL